MCGLSGILNLKQRPADEAVIRRMSDCMSHRGPDADGFFIEHEVALGHRRLSIIDLSEEANHPISDPSGRYILMFNGEIYNYLEVKAQLPDYAYATHGDSEVILASYIKWGAACVEKLAGMFVFIIWDRQSKEMFIARDRMGVKPLYYCITDEYFLFASEIRAILKSGIIQPRLNLKAVDDFLSFQSVGFPHTIIQQVRQMEAGTWMLIKGSATTVKKYWDVTRPAVSFDYADKGRVQQHLYQLLDQAVRRRLISDVPLGAFLSGGIDSSAVVGLMARASNEPVNTFNIGFEEKEFDESGYANIIAKKFNTKHTQIKLQPTVFLDELQNALNSMDTPTGDGVNTYVVSKKIRQSGLIVALSGVGGDELFAGYPFFAQYYKLRKWKNVWGLTNPVRRMAANFIKVNGSTRNDRIRQLLRSNDISIASYYPVSRQIISPDIISQLIKHPVQHETLIEEQLREQAADIDKLPLLSQVSVADYLGYTQHTLLKDTDQMSMAVSLEVREPFFDHDLVEFVLNIPDKLKYPVYPKSLLVESLGDLLPKEIVHRRKQGFTFPWKVWMKNELRAFCDERIQRLSQRDFIAGNAVKERWQRFLKGDESIRWMEIWLLVILQYWLERNHVE